MDSENAALLTAAIFVIVLTLGAWLVRGLTRESVATSWESYQRAERPAAYWFWAIYHVAGLAAFIIALIMVVLYFVVDAFAEDRLQPEDSILGGTGVWSQHYDGIVAGVLKDAYANDVVARMTVIPSFQAEYAVALRKKQGDYSILVVTPAVHLWRYELIADEAESDPKSAEELRKTVPADWHDVKVERCEIALATPLAERLSGIWERMLLETRYPEPVASDIETVGVDGVTYHFYSYGKSGQAWNPGGEAGGLADAGDAMATYCHEKTKAALAALDARSDALLAELKKETGAPAH